APSPLARLDAISTLLRSAMPVSASQLNRLLLEQGLTRKPVSVVALLSEYARAELTPPFRILRAQGVEILVSPGSVDLSARIVSTTAHCIADWGLTSIEVVADRVRAAEGSLASEDRVRRLLMALPRLRWLDEGADWFSFTGERSRLRRAVRKILAVADRVLFADLRSALAKGRSYLLHAPLRALERYLSDLADCEVDGDQEWVRLRRRHAAPVLVRLTA
ncbi:MAG TPA: hypothetical protein VNO55_04295, partial [Polyangia bacterium]|nr:hypothetical protein [Polyangia bacterium]